LIQIIVPAYNTEMYLPATLEGVVAQTFTDWQLIVVNDGSTDSTPAIGADFARRDPRVRVISQPNGGGGTARNHGVEEMSDDCEYLIFLDSDDIWEPDALEILLATLTSAPEAGGAHGTARLINRQGERIRPGFMEDFIRNRVSLRGRKLVPLPVTSPTDFEALVVRNWIITPGICLLRTAALKQTEGFDQKMWGAEDWEVWLDMARRQPFAFVDRVVVNYRHHNKNATKDSGGMRSAESRMLHKNAYSARNTPEQKRVMLAGFRQMQFYHGKDKLRTARYYLKRRWYKMAAMEMGRAGRRFYLGVCTRP